MQSTRDATVLMIGETELVPQKFEHCLAAVLLSMVTASDADQKWFNETSRGCPKM